MSLPDETGPGPIAAAVRRLTEHSFNPVENGFSVDPGTGFDGVPDLEDPDWRVRTLAVRDLVRRGRDGAPAVATVLSHPDPHVRQVGAMALGIVRAEAAADRLRRLLEDDPDPIVRSSAAVALGQIGRPGEALEVRASVEDHPDVRHRCALALARIRRGRPVEPEVAERFAALEESTFERVRVGEPAPDFTLEDTRGESWRLSSYRGESTVVLIWIFADWCPICHREFHELIRRKDRLRERAIEVATLECHDRYRCRVMTGEEDPPTYRFADDFPGATPQARYPEGIWWPHLIDRAARVGTRYGVDPWQFAVHSEWVNRPTTVIVDGDGIVRLAHFGRYWGDRPSISQILGMIESGRYTFEAPPPRRGPH